MPHQDKVYWENSYSIGIRSIDIQHHKLFDIVNKLYDLEESENIKEEIRDILYAFKDYTLVHFKDEERYMQTIGYPDFEAHCKLHEKIIEGLVNIIRTPASLSIIQTKMKVIAKRILIDHIVNEDHKIGIFAQGKGIEEEIFTLDES